MSSLRVRPAALLRRALLRSAVWLMLCAGLAGCLAYREGPLQRRGGLGKVEPGEKSIAVSVKVARTVNGEMRELPDYVRERWIEATLRAYRESGLFTDVRRGVGGPDTDLRASVDVMDDATGSRPFSYLSAMSLFLLPSRSRDFLEVRTTYRDGAGEIVGDYRSKEVVVTWFQILLFPATPFAGRDSVVQNTIRDLSLATAKRGRSKGLF